MDKERLLTTIGNSLMPFGVVEREGGIVES